MNEPTTLDPDQAEELRRLVGTVEYWLLHTSFEFRQDLGAFLQYADTRTTGIRHTLPRRSS